MEGWAALANCVVVMSGGSGIVPPLLATPHAKLVHDTKHQLLHGSPGASAHFQDTHGSTLVGGHSIVMASSTGRHEEQYIRRRAGGRSPTIKEKRKSLPKTGDTETETTLAESQTIKLSKPKSSLMSYEEALDILQQGPPDLSDDPILGVKEDGEEDESHYTPQIVKLMAGKCTVKWEWTTQDLETPHGSKRAARLYRQGLLDRVTKPLPPPKPLRTRAVGRWIVTALIDVQEKLDPKTVKKMSNDSNDDAKSDNIKLIAAMPTTTIAEVSKKLEGVAGPLLLPNQTSQKALEADNWCKSNGGEVMVPHSVGGAHQASVPHPLYYKDFDEVLHGSSGDNADGKLNPTLSLTDYSIGDGDMAQNGLWSRTLHHCSISGAIASVPECKQGYLDLSSRGLQAIPDKVWALREQLSVLNLSDNRLTELDENEIAQIAGLRALLLGENRLSAFPGCIDELTQLRVLQISNNRIPSLAPELSKNRFLTMLCIDGNELKELPDELETLTGLTHLLAHENQFVEVPPVIMKFTNLQELYLQGNQLEHLPGALGSQLSKLEYLDLAGNRLTGLPEEIGDLKRLDVLSLSANLLVWEGIPWQLGMLTDLKKLYMHGNTRLKKEPPAVSRLKECGNLIECELGLHSALRNALTRTFSQAKGHEDPMEVASRAFRKYDSDGSGCIDYMEFRAICVELELTLTKQELKDAMEHLDENKDGTIEEKEFVQWFAHR